MAAIIVFFQGKNRASQQFEDPEGWRQKQHAQPRRMLPRPGTAKCRSTADTIYDAVAGTFICPAGKLL